MLLVIGLIVVNSVALGCLNGVCDGRLVDTDAYSWATRAAELHSTGAWFDDTLDDVYPPVGHAQHWSRPFDVLLLVGSAVGASFVGVTRAIFGWAVALPVVLGVATVWLLWWGFADILGAAGRDAFALLVALQPMILVGFMAGRADHQALIGLLIVATLGFARRAIGETGTRYAMALGALSALGLWVGMEFAIVIAVLYVCLAHDWVQMQDRSAARLIAFSGALAIASTVALVVENGWDGLTQRALDELSIVFVAGAATAAAAAALAVLAHRLATPLRRTGALVAAIFTCGALLILWFPAILGGPLGTVDPLYESTRLISISELQPLLSEDVSPLASVAPSLSLLPFAILGVVVWRRDRAATHGWAPLRMLLVAAIVYSSLAIVQMRWLFALGLMLIVPAALGVEDLMHRAAPRATRVNLGMVGVAALAALWWAPPMLLGAGDVPPTCDMNDAVAALNEPARVGERSQRVMAFTDYGPEIIFRTAHDVFSIPNHRPQPGYTVTYRLMSSTDRRWARREAERQRVDLVLVCSEARIRQVYGDDTSSLHAALTSGHAPPWLTELPMPEGEPRFRLYRVDV